MAYRVVYLVYSIVFILLNTSSMAIDDGLDQDGGITAASADLSQLCAQLYSSKTHVLIGEPFLLNLVVKNTGTNDASIIRCATPGSDYLNYEMIPPGKQPYTITPKEMLLGTGMEARMLAIKPSDYFSRSDFFAYDRKGMLLDEPGEYIFHAMYSLPDGIPGGPMTIRSNGICIVARQPKGIDQEVYDALSERIAKNKKDGEIWSIEIATIPEYEAIINKYQQSKYNVYIHYYLAQTYEFYGKHTAKGTTEAIPSIQKAIMHYQMAAELSKDTPLGIQARQLAGRCYATLGKTEEAEIALRDAFCSEATTEEQIDILSWIKHLERGTFREDLAKPEDVITTRMMLPLRPYAAALGYALTTDKQSGKAMLVRNDY